MSHVEIVSELGPNHNGNPNHAVMLIQAAAKAGCDAVKLQTYRAADFLPQGHPDYEWFQACEIWQHAGLLVGVAHDLGLRIGTTPTSVQGVQEAVNLGFDFVKNGSDFLLRHDVIRAMGDSGLPIVIATGMASEWSEIEAATLALLPTTRRADEKPYRLNCTLLHCTSAYPCPDEEANLSRIRELWRGPVGLSDHTTGHTAAVMAVALGATMIEKHFTLDHGQPGPDHHWSADPTEMKELVDQVRRAEVMLGSPAIEPTPTELEHRDEWRSTIREPLRR